jgi:hypothetical protein
LLFPAAGVATEASIADGIDTMKKPPSFQVIDGIERAKHLQPCRDRQLSNFKLVHDNWNTSLRQDRFSSVMQTHNSCHETPRGVARYLFQFPDKATFARQKCLMNSR